MLVPILGIGLNNDAACAGYRACWTTLRKWACWTILRKCQTILMGRKCCFISENTIDHTNDNYDKYTLVLFTPTFALVFSPHVSFKTTCPGFRDLEPGGSRHTLRPWENPVSSVNANKFNTSPTWWKLTLDKQLQRINLSRITTHTPPCTPPATVEAGT